MLELQWGRKAESRGTASKAAELRGAGRLGSQPGAPGFGGGMWATSSGCIMTFRALGPVLSLGGAGVRVVKWAGLLL